MTSTANDVERNDFDDDFFVERVGKVSVPNLLQDYYQERNETLEYLATSTVTYGTTQSPPPALTVDLLFKVPQHQELVYIPSVLEVLKQAWVQYVYVLIPLYFALYFLLFGYLVENRIFTSVEKSELHTAAKIKL